MITSGINELFESINSSKEYQDYLKIKDVLEKDKNIISLIDEIKSLQQQSVNLEFSGNMEYKEIDKIIEKKAEILNNNPTYQEYLNKIEEFNNILTTSSKILENYVKDKI